MQLLFSIFVWNWVFQRFVTLPLPTDKRTDVWSRPSCIYTQIFSPKMWFLHVFRVKKICFCKKAIMQLFSAATIVFSKKLKKHEKKRPQKLLIVGPKLFFFMYWLRIGPKWIFHIIKMSQDSSVYWTWRWAVEIVGMIVLYMSFLQRAGAD